LQGKISGVGGNSLLIFKINFMAKRLAAFGRKPKSKSHKTAKRLATKKVMLAAKAMKKGKK
jgi:hypothetical protein